MEAEGAEFTVINGWERVEYFKPSPDFHVTYGFGFDEAFDETGGGQANLDLYKRLVEHRATELVVLPGEGSFHQFHGGVTTGQQGQKRHDAMVAHFAQYAALRGGAYQPPRKRPIYFGPVPDGAVRFIRNSGNMLIDAMREEEEI